jgi:hypothetical protein
MGMLMGAELQAAIMQKRTQLRPVAPAGSVQAAAGRAAPPHQPVQGGARPLQRQCTSADAGQETMDFMQEVSKGCLKLGGMALCGFHHLCCHVLCNRSSSGKLEFDMHLQQGDASAQQHCSAAAVA